MHVWRKITFQLQYALTMIAFFFVKNVQVLCLAVAIPKVYIFFVRSQEFAHFMHISDATCRVPLKLSFSIYVNTYFCV